MQTTKHQPGETKSMSQVIRETGLKATGARGKVLRVLTDAKKPLRVKDIFERVQMTDEDMNMVTIYRTIETFVKKGIVHRDDFGEDAAYYELHDDKRHHHYITCTGCKRHDDIEGCFYEGFEPELRAQVPHYDSITYHTVEYFGLCSACKEREDYQKSIIDNKR
ncbi:MAG TPA: Fur family transcriptional regulator [Candidatus Paceibacterota bacterium]|nr:Fur family transcriptional regulator [Candidatus Paceibacterota bacterium]